MENPWRSINNPSEIDTNMKLERVMPKRCQHDQKCVQNRSQIDPNIDGKAMRTIYQKLMANTLRKSIKNLKPMIKNEKKCKSENIQLYEIVRGNLRTSSGASGGAWAGLGSRGKPGADPGTDGLHRSMQEIVSNWNRDDHNNRNTNKKRTVKNTIDKNTSR